MSIRKHLTVLLCFVFSLSVYAQSAGGKFQVTGNVSDSDGEPLAGVTVSVKEQPTLAVATDLDGNYKISVPGKNSTLKFSYIGMKPAEEKVNGRNVINVTMTSMATELDDVVVVGYGSQSREMLTTSISKVDNKVLENVPYTNLTQALQGSVSGIRVQSTSGQPGEAARIIVRGGTSIQSPDGAAPLYVVDGITREDINHISANDIESIQVLKDAASTSIYGAKGSNGVVIITTKSAKEGKATVNYSYDLTFSTMGKTYDFASAEEYITFQRRNRNPATSPAITDSQHWWSSQSTPFGTGNDLSNNSWYTTQYLTDANKHKLQEGWKSMADPEDPTKTLIYQENDWSNLATRTGISHNHHVEVGGSSDRAKFLAGIGYMTTEGILKGTDYDRLSFNLNGEVNILKNLSVNARMYFTQTTRNNSPFSMAGAFYRIPGTAPTTKIYNEDGSLTYGTSWGEANPLYALNVVNPKDKIRTQNQTYSFGGNWNILPELSFKPSISMYRTQSMVDKFTPSHYNGRWIDNTREASAERHMTTHYQVDAVLNYIKTFKEDHNLNVMLGLNYTQRDYDDVWAGGKGGSNNNITTVNGIAEKTSASSSTSTHKMMGYFGRINYNYQNKYLLTLTARYDGASNLGKNNRYGFFPGASAGWRIDQEDFYPEDLKRNLQAKIRASYGVNGNINGLADWTSYGYYSAGATHFGNPAIRMGWPANNDVKWERSKTFDIGADFKIWDNRIDVTVDWFRRRTDDLITLFKMPYSTGLTDVYTNNGSLENKGLEIEVNARVLNFDKDGVWRIGFNASKVTNKILALPDNGVENNRQGGQLIYDPKQGKNVWVGGIQEGGTIGNHLILYDFKGVYKTDEEAAKAPYHKLCLSSDPNKTQYGGDAIFADTNNDGVLDEYDRVYAGNSLPDWTGGINTSLSWKGLELYVRADYTLGHTIFNWAKNFMDYSMSHDSNFTKDIVKYSWQKQGDDAKMPRYNVGNECSCSSDGTYQSTLYIEKGDFLCLREVTLSYNFCPELFKKARLSNVRVAITGSNLCYITGYKGLSPEEGGVDDGRYPMPRNVTCSVGLTF